VVVSQNLFLAVFFKKRNDKNIKKKHNGDADSQKMGQNLNNY
jgi:hypothetical protein